MQNCITNVTYKNDRFMVARVVNLKLVFKFDHTGQVIKNPIPKLRESCIITDKLGYLFEH